MRTQQRRVIGAAIALFIGVAMGVADTVGFSDTWSEPARLAWAVMCVFAMIGGFSVLVATFIGLFDELAQHDFGGARARTFSGAQFVAVYLASVGGVITLAAVAWQVWRVPFPAAVLAGAGSLLLLGSSGRPWWLYATLRSAGWFAAVGSDRTMRFVLATFGTGALLLGVALGAR